MSQQQEVGGSTVADSTQGERIWSSLALYKVKRELLVFIFSGVSGWRPKDATSISMEPSSPVSDVSLQFEYH